MKKLLVEIVCVAGLACGAPAEEPNNDANRAALTNTEDQELAEPGSDEELGALEQAFTESACGTNTVDRNTKITGVAQLPLVRAPYGSSSCTNAFINGINATQAKKTDLSIFSQMSQSSTDCPSARFKVRYFANNAFVGAVEGPGVARGGTRCVAAVTVKFDPARTTVATSGNSLLLPGGAPPASANARLVLQALNKDGALQNINFEVIRFQ